MRLPRLWCDLRAPDRSASRRAQTLLPPLSPTACAGGARGTSGTRGASETRGTGGTHGTLSTRAHSLRRAHVYARARAHTRAYTHTPIAARSICAALVRTDGPRVAVISCDLAVCSGECGMGSMLGNHYTPHGTALHRKVSSRADASPMRVGAAAIYTRASSISVARLSSLSRARTCFAHTPPRSLARAPTRAPRRCACMYVATVVVERGILV